MLLNQVSPPWAGISSEYSIVEHVRDDIDLRIAWGRLAPRTLVRGRVERAEMSRERQQIVVRQLLVPEHQHIVPVPRVLDGVDLRPGGVGEIYTLEFGAKDSEGKHFEVEYD